MSAVELFPRGVATGSAFCDRDQERARLAANILAPRPRHTWISGRRRHGKTSLVAEVLQEIAARKGRRVEHVLVDVFVVHNLRTLDEALRAAIGSLSGRLLPRRKRALDYLGKAFAAFKPELTLGPEGVKLKLAGEAPSAGRIDAMLRALDKAALHYGVRGVVVIDEFQQISRLDEGHAVEGAIRSVAQSSQALAFVFLGSERTLLQQMFENRERPLYLLCEHLEIGRIEAGAYRAFLQDAARLRWGRQLADDAAERILALSERHPFYVNALARPLWERRKPPTMADVESAWTELLAADAERLKAQLLTVPNLTRGVLRTLTLEPTATPTAQPVLSAAGLSAGTVAKAVRWLEEHDFLWRGPDQVLRPVDPLLGAYLRSL